MQKPPINWTNTLLFSITPAVAIILVPWYGIYSGYDGFEWAMFALLMWFCGLSITAGYHRLWSHKSYQAHPALRLIFALGGACALQNDVLTWASDHRRHHTYVDDNERDPYSAKKGLWFSHIGWMLRHYDSGKEDLSNVKDLQKDPILVWQRKHYLTLVLVMNIGLPVLLGILHGDVIASVLLAGLLRLVLSQHVTYLINSLAHAWGDQTYSTASTARDNGFIAMLTYGEGYHNFHHTFQWDYRNGIKWWHWDPTKWMIRLLSWVGLTSKLRRCNEARIESAKLEVQYLKATSNCDRLGLPEKWRKRIEEEYSELVETLQIWSSHRQSWYAARSRHLHEQFEHLDLVRLRDAYREIQLRLKSQKRRWQLLIQSLYGAGLANAATG